MIAELIPELQKLSLEEKLTLSDELWREVTGAEVGQVDPNLVQKLNRRYEEYVENPDLGISAGEMKRRFNHNHKN